MGKALNKVGDFIADLGQVGATLLFGVTGFVIASLPQAIEDDSRATEFSYRTDAGLPIPFGRVPYAGDVNYRVAYDATNRYQSIFATMGASGPIKAVVSFAGDDELTSFDANDKATNGEHEGALWVKTLLGDQPQAAITSPTGPGAGIAAPEWGSDHKQSGRAVYCMTMFENSKLSEYQGGIVKPRFILEGVYGWDPRQDSTWPGGSGSCDIEDPSTWVWIDNPAIAALNWVIGRWEGLSPSYSPARYGVPYDCSIVAGLGASLDGIDVAAFMNAANVADANGWTVAAVPTSTDDKYEVLTKLLQACGAEPARRAGRISCVVFAEEVASVVTVTAADTAGPVQLSLGQSRLERKNSVIGSFWSEAHNWEKTQISPVSNPAWVTEDGGSLRSKSLSLPYVPDENQAAQLSYYHLANARERVSGSVPFKPHMRRIEPGDCFTFAEPGFMLDGVKVRCLKRSYDPMTGGVRITFRQETDAKHAAALAVTGTAPPPVDPDTPPPPYVEPPTLFSVIAAGSDVSVTWRNPSTINHDYVEVWRALASTNFADASLVTSNIGGPSEVEFYLDVAPGVGAISYWLVAVDLDGNSADPLGPETVTLADLLTAGGDFLVAGPDNLTLG